MTGLTAFDTPQISGECLLVRSAIYRMGLIGMIKALSNSRIASANDSGSDAESSNGSRQSPNASEAKSKQRGRPKRQSAVKPASSPPVDEDQEGKDEEGEGDEDEEMDEDVYGSVDPGITKDMFLLT